MRKILFTCILATNAFAAISQSKYFIQPIIGFGTGTIVIKQSDKPHYPFVRENYRSGNGSISIGRNFKDISVTAGIGLLAVGNQVNNYPIGSGLTAETADIFESIGFLSIPLNISYSLHLSRFSINPSVGISPAYWMYTESRTIINSYESKGTAWGSAGGNGFSLSGNVKLYAGFEVNKKLTLIGGPSVHYVYTNLFPRSNGNHFT